MEVVAERCTTGAGCGTRDYESLIGGYEKMHATESITFDVDASTSDLVVGGKAFQYVEAAGFVYYIQDSICQVRWAFFLPPLGEGVK